MVAQEISVTEASRNFAACVNRAHYQNMSFVLLKNGVPVARIVPEPPKGCTGAVLAGAVKDAELPPEEGRVWHKDLKAARRRLAPPRDKWR